MSLRNTRERWGGLSKTFHWSIAVLMIGLAVIGTYMANFERDMLVQYELTQWHKSFGFVVFVLALLRIVWRWMNPVSPSLPDNLKSLERVAAHVTHYGLYLLMFLLPVSGWLMASASPLNDEGAYPTQIKNLVFGLFELPDPIAPGDKQIEGLLHLVHEFAAYGLGVLLVLHVGAALKHHVVLRDNVLLRMLPFARLREDDAPR